MFEELALPISNSEKMYILHPSTGEPIVDNEGNKAYIEIRSSNSKEAKAVERRILNKQLRHRGKRTIEDIEDERAEYLASLIVNWHLVKNDGTKFDIECTDNNKLKFLKNDSLFWIRTQVDEFAGDLENFLEQRSMS